MRQRLASRDGLCVGNAVAIALCVPVGIDDGRGLADCKCERLPVVDAVGGGERFGNTIERRVCECARLGNTV